MNRRAKIVCTLGPASRSPEIVRALVDAGMNVARLNFSHGTHEDHAAACATVRRAAESAGRAVAVMADLQGPKIRLGTFRNGEAVLEAGAEFTITPEPCDGDARRASITYPAIVNDVQPGDTLLIDDGNVRLKALTTSAGEVRTRVIEGGRVSDHKGVNLPGVALSLTGLTDKDRDDLRFALALPVDLIALSFVRSAADAEPVRLIMREVATVLPVIAKIEKPEAVEALDEIARAFDGIMVARGDLGVELPLERVPLVQKHAVSLARSHAKPVIIATQMLESMVTHSRPTRAEASDVANAVLDGSDALMLSAETGVGAHAIESVVIMDRIIATAESEGPQRIPPLIGRPTDPHAALAAAAVGLARDLGACALVAFTHSGATARRLASHRAAVPLFAFTSEAEVRTRLAPVWGVETFVVPRAADTDTMVSQVDRAMLELGRGRPGELVVIVAGTPPGTAGATNTIRVHRLGAGRTTATV
jgi:pyruvate kinase